MTKYDVDVCTIPVTTDVYTSCGLYFVKFVDDWYSQDTCDFTYRKVSEITMDLFKGDLRLVYANVVVLVTITKDIWE